MRIDLSIERHAPKPGLKDFSLAEGEFFHLRGASSDVIHGGPIPPRPWDLIL